MGVRIVHMEVTACIISMLRDYVEVSSHDDMFIFQVIIVLEHLSEEHGALIVIVVLHKSLFGA